MTRLPLLQYDTNETVLHLLGCRVRCSIENTVEIVKPGTDDTESECLGSSYFYSCFLLTFSFIICIFCTCMANKRHQ